MSYILHYHPLSSFCWKLLIPLYDCAIDFTPRLLNLMDPDERAAFLKLSPMGKMPALEDHERARVLTESSLIIEYLALNEPSARSLVPADANAALRVRQLDRVFDLYVHDPMQRIVADRLRPKEERDAYGVAQQRAKLRDAYAMLEREIPEAGWAAGEEFTLADCAAFPALFYAGQMEAFEPQCPKLAAYMLRLSERPSVARVVKEAEPFFAMVPRE